MSTLVRFLQFFSLGFWIGSILYFGAIVAPSAFTLLTADQAGGLVGVTLGRLHLAGILAGAIYLVATAAGERSPAALVRPAPLLVVAMIALTFVSQFWVTGTMEGLRAQMGSVSATPATSALRVSFDRLHVLSVRLEGIVLLCGLAVMALTSRLPAAAAAKPAP